MSRIYVPSSGPDDWRALLADPTRQWRTGFSAQAAARSWEAANGLPPEIADILGPDAEFLLAIPEHKVRLTGGTRPSQCDVFAMLRAGDQTIALSVEAKVNEPFDRTLRDWMGAGTTGKRERLESICALLGCADPPGHLRYQLFHRTAAAVIEAARFKTDAAAMIVQSFAQDHRWFDDFAMFCDFLGLKAERGKPLDYTLPGGHPLTLGWATGDSKFLADVPVSTAKKNL